MRIEQIKQYVNDYNFRNETNFIIYHESKIYTLYFDGYNNGSATFNSTKDLKTYLNGYIRALETFKK